MRDRFTRGFVAGILAGIPTFLFNHGSRLVGFGSLTWSDFFGTLIYGRKPELLWEKAFAVFGVYVFLAFLGALFALAIPRISSQNYLLKGWLFSLAVWFASFAVATLFAVPGLSPVSPITTISLSVGASIWGLALGYALKWLDLRVTS